jgi:hypothetical protein
MYGYEDMHVTAPSGRTDVPAHLNRVGRARAILHHDTRLHLHLVRPISVDSKI